MLIFVGLWVEVMYNHLGMKTVADMVPEMGSQVVVMVEGMEIGEELWLNEHHHTVVRRVVGGVIYIEVDLRGVPISSCYVSF